MDEKALVISYYVRNKVARTKILSWMLTEVKMNKQYDIRFTYGIIIQVWKITESQPNRDSSFFIPRKIFLCFAQIIRLSNISEDLQSLGIIP
jgi:hypothetical protein